MEEETFILHVQFHHCWWAGNIRSQGISSNGIVFVFLEYSSFSTRSILILEQKNCRKIFWGPIGRHGSDNGLVPDDFKFKEIKPLPELVLTSVFPVAGVWLRVWRGHPGGQAPSQVALQRYRRPLDGGPQVPGGQRPQPDVPGSGRQVHSVTDQGCGIRAKATTSELWPLYR